MEGEEEKKVEAVPEVAAEIKPEEKPKFTVNFGDGKGPKVKSTLNIKAPEGGWNPSIHQKEKKPVGKTKDS